MWEWTAKGLLTIKLRALEQVLQQRQEILAALQPIPAEVSLRQRQQGAAAKRYKHAGRGSNSCPLVVPNIM